MEYGLIGSKLGHSYSKIIHEMLCGYRYDLCPLPTEEEARAFLIRRQFKAINVTIPYKRLVMEYCTYIDPRAKAIGAVNTVVNKNGLLYGYNTDYLACPPVRRPRRRFCGQDCPHPRHRRHPQHHQRRRPRQGRGQGAHRQPDAGRRQRPALL